MNEAPASSRTLNYLTSREFGWQPVVKVLSWVMILRLVLHCISIAGDLGRFFFADRQDYEALTWVWFVLSAGVLISSAAGIIAMFMLIRQSIGALRWVPVTMISYLISAAAVLALQDCASLRQLIRSMNMKNGWIISCALQSVIGIVSVMLQPLVMIWLVRRSEVREGLVARER
jgi:hypothetical protein